MEDASNYVTEHGKVKTGSAAITSGEFGKLKCKYIIHAVGPNVYGTPSSEDKDNLRSSIKKVCKLAEENNVKKLSIPSISSGIFGFPKDECAKIIVSEICLWIDKIGEKSCIEEIRFTNNDSFTSNIFKEIVSKLADNS